MDNKNGFTITDRDHVRDYQAYAHELEKENKELAKLFSQFAEDEAVHAAKLLDLLRGYEK